jgi:hypothetical protein
MTHQIDSKVVFMKQEDVMNSTGFCIILKDKWFAIHPETGDLIFWQDNKRRKGQLLGASPQCHSDKVTLEILLKSTFPWAKVKFFERVAYPICIDDY